MTTRNTDTAPPRDRLAFDRSDRWGLAGLLLLMVAAALATWVVGPVVDWVRGRALRVEMYSDVSVPALDRVGVRHGLGTYDIHLADPTAAQRLASLLPGLVWLGLVIAGALLVARVMRTIADGDPFVRSNVHRLRALAGLLVLGTPAAFALDMWAHVALVGQLDLGNLVPGFVVSPPYLAMVSGLVVALLAEAFKAGIALRNDVEGLV